MHDADLMSMIQSCRRLDPEFGNANKKLLRLLGSLCANRVWKGRTRITFECTDVRLSIEVTCPCCII